MKLNEMYNTMPYTILYYTALYCTVLHYTVLYYTAVHYTQELTRAHHAPASIDDDGLPSDEAGWVAGQEGDSLGHLPHSPRSAQGMGPLR